MVVRLCTSLCRLKMVQACTPNSHTIAQLGEGKAANSVQAVNALQELIMVHFSTQLQYCPCCNHNDM